MVSLVGYATDENAIKRYSGLTKLSSDELIDLGNDCFMRSVNDSALVCYSIIINRHQTDSREDKFRLIRAYNNRGCVALCYLDYQRAYQCFVKAVNLSDEYKIDEIKLTARLNMINLLSVYNGSRFSSRPMSPDAESRYEELMAEAVQKEEWRTYLTVFLDLVEQNPTIDLKKFDNILSQNLPDPTNDLSNARIYYRAIECEQQRRYNEARQWFGKFLNDSYSTHIIPERFVLMAHMGIARTYAHEHNYTAAIAELQKTESMRLSGQAIDNVIAIYEKLSEYYHALGDDVKSQYYKIQQLEKMDSVNDNNSLMNMLVNDLQQEEMRNRELADKHRRQRNLFIGSILVLFVILMFTAGLLRANRKVNTRNKSLYEKNQAMMQAEAEERLLRKDYEQKIETLQQQIQQASAEASKTDKKPQDIEVKTETKYSKSNLSDEDRQRLIGKIQDMLSDAEVICQQDFTMAKFAKLVGSNTTYVSQVINEKYGITFSNLLGRYRVQESCRRMDDIEHYGHMTIEAISESVGFRSRVAFLNAFKREIGLTPSEYLRMAKDKHNQ